VAVIVALLLAAAFGAGDQYLGSLSRHPWAANVSLLSGGPFFGWFGYRWRTELAWVGALVTATAVCLEPLARIPVRGGALTCHGPPARCPDDFVIVLIDRNGR
jgi:hypothetical protein